MTFNIFLSIVGLSAGIIALTALVTTIYLELKSDKTQQSNFELLKGAFLKCLLIAAVISAVAKKETVEYLLYTAF